MDDMKKLLNTLKSIDGTLKRIEQKLNDEKQHSVIKEAVSHALLGDKYETTPKDDVANILYQQLQLLAEESKNAERNERGYKPGLTEYSDSIYRISSILRDFLNARETDK